MAELFTEYRPKDWPEFRNLLWMLSVGDWVFRGQRDANWPVSSTLERSVPAYLMKGLKNDKDGKAEVGKYLEAMEEPLFLKFSERLDAYIGKEAGASTVLGQMALMQHHGVPTRLVDFTESPYVASFFAVEDALDPDGECAIWVINHAWCLEKSAQAVRKEKERAGEEFKEYVDFSDIEILFDTIFQLKLPFVVPFRPSKLNERIASQQGLFLCPGELDRSFMENLYALGKKELPDFLIKIVFPASWRGLILYDLRSMNIGPHTLFPGLDGYARWVKLQLDLTHAYGQVEEEFRRYTTGAPDS